MNEQKILLSCGLVAGIIGVLIMISQYFYHVLGIPRTIDEILTGLIYGFMLTQVGINLMLVSFITKIAGEVKK